MKTNDTLRLTLLVGAFLATSAFSARAVTQVPLSSTTDNTYDSLIVAGETNDLILNKVGTLSDALPVSNGDTGPDIDFSIGGLTDGKSTDGMDSTQTFFGTTHFSNAENMNFGNSLNYDPIVTFNLGSSPTGYTLSTIQSIFGYTNEASFADQNYTIQFTTVGNSSWQALATVAYNPFDPPSTDVLSGVGSTDVTLTGLTAAVGVTDIRFEFSPYVDSSGEEQFGQVIRELEVNGVATVPEPGTWALMLLGSGGLVFLGRRKLA
jgi:hypothetical protein